jgi:DNA primase
MSRLIGEWFNQNFEVKPTHNPSKIYICCPFCVKVSEGRKSADTKFHMGVTFTPVEKSPVPCVHCFRCGYSASIKKFIKACEGPDAFRFNKRFKQALDDLSVVVSPVVESQEVFVPLPKDYSPLDPRCISHGPAIQYLKQRGISKHLWKLFQLGFCMDGPYSGRIIFPIYFQRKLVGFTARIVIQTVSQYVPKYQFPSGFSASSFLYNFDRASQFQKVVVMEGVFDVLRFPQNAVALFGKAMSVQQKLKLVSTWKEVIVMLDSDAGESAYRIQKELSPFVNCTVAKLSNGDPADNRKSDLVRALEERNEGMEFII